MSQKRKTHVAPSAQPSSPLKKARSEPLGERTSEEPRVHGHVRLYSSASPSLKSTKGVFLQCRKLQISPLLRLNFEDTL